MERDDGVAADVLDGGEVVLGEALQVFLAGADHEAFGAHPARPVVAAEDVGVFVVGVGVFVGDAEVVEELVGDGGVAVVDVPVELVGAAGFRGAGQGDGLTVGGSVDEFGGDVQLVAGRGKAVAAVDVRVEDFLHAGFVSGEIGGREAVRESERDGDEEVADGASVAELFAAHVVADQGHGAVEASGAGVELAQFGVEAFGVHRGGLGAVEGAQVRRLHRVRHQLTPLTPTRCLLGRVPVPATGVSGVGGGGGGGGRRRLLVHAPRAGGLDRCRGVLR
ncbi:hypothetical protein GUY61_30105, partial [Streptomyces sp. GC420]|nr:hypothetical protein [Streptomyces sp. GC420]